MSKDANPTSSASIPGLPEKLYDYTSHLVDPSRWDGFVPREDDIIISTSYKAGTTWMQTIVANLLFQDGNMPDAVLLLSPWLDMRHRPLDEIMARLQAQTHRRFIKTHLPLDGLPYFSEVKYIVVGRDARDVFMSLLNHHHGYTPEAIEKFNTFSDALGHSLPTCLGDDRTAWKNWITRSAFAWESDGYPYWSHLHHIQSWWDFKHLPNVLLVHYNNLLADPEAGVRAVAAYLGISIDESHLARILDHISFGAMKRNFNDTINPNAPNMFKGGGATFMNKGTNGHWREVLNEADLQLYEQAKARAMTPDAAHWLETGEKAA